MLSHVSPALAAQLLLQCRACAFLSSMTTMWLCFPAQLDVLSYLLRPCFQEWGLFCPAVGTSHTGTMAGKAVPQISLLLLLLL